MAHSQRQTTPDTEPSWESMDDVQSIEEFLNGWPPFFDPPLFHQHVDELETPTAELPSHLGSSQTGGTHVQSADLEAVTIEDDLMQYINHHPWKTSASQQEPQMILSGSEMDISSPESVLQIGPSPDTQMTISPSSNQAQTSSAGPSKSQTPRIRERKCPCEVHGCDRSFCFPKDLRRHDAVHVPNEEAPRPWKCHVEGCPQSQRGYKRRDALLRHVRAKHTESLDA